jgi:dihydroorotase
MICQQVGELEDIRYADVERAIEVVERNRDIIKGIKVRLSRSIVGDNGIRPLLLAKKVSEAVKMPIMVHPGNTHMPITNILAELREGDILTHCFHGLEQNILDNHGTILDEVREASKRGVIFDVGHGRSSFSFDIAEKALAQDVTPQTISSDLHYYNLFGPVHSLATTLSKFFYLGLSFYEALAKVTSTPAKLLGINTQLGSLKPGSIADISIFNLKKGRFSFEDTMKRLVIGNRLLEPAAVLKGGQLYAGRLRLKRSRKEVRP